MTGSNLPLAGWTILLTRPLGRGASLAGILRALGASVDCRPTIALVPPRDPSPVVRAVSELDRNDWLVFTSVSGARFFAEACREAGRSLAGLRARVAAIGPATSTELVKAGLSVAVEAQESTAEGLLAALGGLVRSGERLLLVQPEATRDTLERGLAELGGDVRAVALYRNEPAPDVDRVLLDLVRGSYRIVVFTSPSTLDRLLEADRDGVAREALRSVRRVAIGARTARALVEAGLGPHATALRPTDDSIRDAVLESCVA